MTDTTTRKLRLAPMAGDTLQGKRITLIGGAGFIGHNLALELVRQGARVDVVDSLQVNNLLSFAAGPRVANREMNLRILHERLTLLQQADVQVHPVDARDYHMLCKTLGQTQPEVIVQLAAVAHANRSNKDPYSTFDHSLRTLENALDFARVGGVEHFVYFSSSMVYGNFQSEKIDEEHPLNPIGIYGALKLSGEKIVIAYQQVFGLPYTIVRPAALYGPRCVSRRVCQIFIENALSGQPLRVEGDGAESIDFTFIDDLVQGVCLSIRKPAAKNQIFNMTYGDARTIKELLDAVRVHCPSVQVQHAERDKLRPFRGTMSIDKAKELMGYFPQNPIEVGVGKYVEWYRGLGFGQQERIAA